MRDPNSLVDVITASTVKAAQAALVTKATGWDAMLLAALAWDTQFDSKRALIERCGLLKWRMQCDCWGCWERRWQRSSVGPHAAPTMEQSRVSAQEAKRAHKARYDNEAWLEISRAGADRLRESQRAALVAYLLPRLGFSDPGQLFEHFLIDVEMSPCMQTSRIKQAISSVQLFVQRCRMNLEPRSWRRS